MDPIRLDKLRKRGLLEKGPDGQESVRVSLQQFASAQGLTRSELKERLRACAAALQEQLAGMGGCVIPDTLSVAGQTFEALIPADKIQFAAEELARKGLRVDLVEPRQII